MYLGGVNLFLLRSRYKNAIHDIASKIRRTSIMNPSAPPTRFTKFVDIDEVSFATDKVIITLLSGAVLIPVQSSLDSYSCYTAVV